MSEGPRRLPLISLATPPSKPLSVHPSPVVAATLAIADTGDGAAALSIARSLAEACLLTGRAPFVVLSAFYAAPALPFAGLGALRAARLAVSTEGDVAAFVQTHADVPGPWICVGVPTLRALSGALRVLLVVAGAARTHEREAAAGDEAVDLQLASARPSLAQPLMAAWLAAI